MERVLIPFIPAVIGNLIFAFYLFEIDREEPMRYFSSCEYSSKGAFRQPTNSWSSMAHMAVGLLTAWQGAYLYDPSGKRNLMTSHWYLPCLSSSLLVLIGGMSLFYHGLATEFGARMDALMILWFLSFLTVISSLRLCAFLNYSQDIKYRFLVNFILLCMFDYVVIFKGTHDQKDLYRNWKIGAAIIAEVIYGTVVRSRGHHFWFFGLTVLSVAVGFWQSERCDDHSHSVWHSLSAISLGLIVAHFQTSESEFRGTLLP